MTNSWKLTFSLLALALAFALPRFAAADDAATADSAPAADAPAAAPSDLEWSIFPPAAADAPNQNNANWLTPQDWGVSLLLPVIGKLHLPSDADWSAGDLDFQWFDDANLAGTGGIYQVDGNFVELQDTALSHGDIAALMSYTQGLLTDSIKAQIISSQENLIYAGRSWNEIYFRQPEAQDEAGPTTTYCFFSPDKNGMYMVFFYCDDPPNSVVASDISTVLGDFVPAGDAKSAGS